MKYYTLINGDATTQSHPARGAWIEIAGCRASILSTCRRTPQGVRGLKSFCALVVSWLFWSHPARGAWIEIYASDVTYWSAAVAPRKGCVD